MMGHNISFKRVIWKIIPKLSLNYPFHPFLSGALLYDMMAILSKHDMISTLPFCLNIFIFKSCIY